MGGPRYAGRMIRLILPILVLPAGAALAGDDVTAPEYLPAEGVWFGNTLYSFSRTASDTMDSRGVRKAFNRADLSLIDQTLFYGITDDVALTLAGAYGWQTSRHTPETGARSNLFAGGFEDPSLTGTWRVLHEAAQGINLDLIGLYSPDLFALKSPSATQAGTLARGEQVATLATAISHGSDTVSLYGEGLASFLGRRMALDPASGKITEYGTAWQYALDGQVQFRPSAGLAFTLGVEEIFDADRHAATSPADSSRTPAFLYRPGRVTTIDLSADIAIIPDRLLIGLVYEHEFLDTSRDLDPADPRSIVSATKGREDLIGLLVRYRLD
jgi:hypothetical protein